MLKKKSVKKNFLAQYDEMFLLSTSRSGERRSPSVPQDIPATIIWSGVKRLPVNKTPVPIKPIELLIDAEECVFPSLKLSPSLVIS